MCLRVCVCVHAAVCKDRVELHAVRKDQARNLCKQSSGHNGSPAKHWVSHQPQPTTHKHECTNTKTNTCVSVCV